MIKNIIWLISCNLLLLNFISIEVHGGKGHKRLDVNMCCNAEVGDDQKDLDSKFLELKDQCVTEIFGDEPKEKHRGRGGFVCIAECIAKKSQVVDESGNLNEGNIAEFIKTQRTAVEHQKAAADEIATKCYAEIKNQEDSEKPAGKCNPTALKAHFCVDRELFKSCPKDKQDTSEKCVKMRENIESGKFGKHHGRHGNHGSGEVPPPPSSEDESDSME